MKQYSKDPHLNRQIRELSTIRLNISKKKFLFVSFLYLVSVPFITYFAVQLQVQYLIYIYLIPLIPTIFLAYLLLTGKFKWLIKILHKLHVLARK